MKSDNPNPYADIIDLPHHVSKRHPQMPMEKRAAQFSPFAAMVGHDATIREATESVGGTNPKASQNHQNNRLFKMAIMEYNDASIRYTSYV